MRHTLTARSGCYADYSNFVLDLKKSPFQQKNSLSVDLKLFANCYCITLCKYKYHKLTVIITKNQPSQISFVKNT